MALPSLLVLSSNWRYLETPSVNASYLLFTTTILNAVNQQRRYRFLTSQGLLINGQLTLNPASLLFHDNEAKLIYKLDKDLISDSTVIAFRLIDTLFNQEQLQVKVEALNSVTSIDIENLDNPEIFILEIV